ncbi:MAG: DUF362 domain-containing protein [Bryobacteraceae bacterium]
MRDNLPLTRRFFFLGALASSLACDRTRRSSSRTESLVSIRRAGSYQQDLDSIVRSILVEHRVPVRGKTIVIKPNLVEFAPGTPINTHPLFVASVQRALLAEGAAHVQVAEGPGHRRATFEMAESAGYFEAIPAFDGDFTDLNLDDVKLVRPARVFSTRLSELYLPATILNADLVVSLPKMKTHHWAGATLSMKNLFGIIPGAVYGWPKNLLHWAGIPQSIATIHQLVPRQFSIVDGIEAMEGNGPIVGRTKTMGVIVAGANPIQVDSTCCRIMGINPERVEYLRLASTLHPPSAAHQIGERIETVRNPFELPRGFDDLRLS